MNKKADGSTLESFSYTYDNTGNQLTKTENGTTTTYIYDKLNQLIKENKTAYTYDDAGNRLSKADGTDTVSYAYDQRNRLTQETKNGIISTYSYDNNGNLIAASDGTRYIYDAFNRLVETNNPDGTWQQNIYDATGLRMATVENGSFTEYTFDRGSIIANHDKDGNRTTRYIRGYDLVSQKDKEGNTSYYLHNAHGDVTKLVDMSGNIRNSYGYDAFGNTISYTENVENRFRYAGEQYDAVTDQYYLRARYYEPGTGRFTQEDRYRGDGLNLYAYVANNPVIFIDPTGLCKDTVSNDRTDKSGVSALDIAKTATISTLEGVADAIVGNAISKLPNTTTKIVEIPSLGVASKVGVSSLKSGTKALKFTSKAAGPVAAISYGYDVYQDIKKYDGMDAVKAVTVTTVGTALTIAAGLAISGAGAPVAVAIVAGVGVSLLTNFVGDKLKKWWIGF